MILRTARQAALWGDSFAAHLAPGIKANTSLMDYDVLQYSVASCAPILDREWGNQPINADSAADYVRLLGGAYQAAHAADPDIVVLTAGLSPTGVTENHCLPIRTSAQMRGPIA